MPRAARAVLIVGVAANISLLGYYKYADFFIGTINEVFETNWIFTSLILPLAISFYTFQKIAYLVDTFHQKTNEYGFLNYCLFVTFFPQLISGPIVHHREMMGQFSRAPLRGEWGRNLAIGLSIFIIGLFKKVICADQIAKYVDPLFLIVSDGGTLLFFEAWGAGTGFALQLYFDFSGYSDMAIGIAVMFGIKLPLNFYSPYKAVNFAEFWRRWHMTLSRFLHDYVFLPLARRMSRRARLFAPLMITMLLGGLWHGAGWHFVIFGILCGLTRWINEVFRSFRRRVLNHNLARSSRIGVVTAVTVTFLTTVFLMVSFRADNLTATLSMYESMVGIHGGGLSVGISSLFSYGPALVPTGEVKAVFSDIKADYDIWKVIFPFLFIVWFTPNVFQLMEQYDVAVDSRAFLRADTKYLVGLNQMRWRPNWRWILYIAALAIISLLYIPSANEFVYFQF